MKIMKILDTNMILRFLLNDIIEMSNTVKNIIDNNRVIITTEVIAEVVYVMKSVYKIERLDISNAILKFLTIKNVTSNDMNVIVRALHLFSENNLDFVDCILCAYHTELGYEVCSFDKKLNKLISKN